MPVCPTPQPAPWSRRYALIVTCFASPMMHGSGGHFDGATMRPRPDQPKTTCVGPANLGVVGRAGMPQRLGRDRSQSVRRYRGQVPGTPFECDLLLPRRRRRFPSRAEACIGRATCVEIVPPAVHGVWPGQSAVRAHVGRRASLPGPPLSGAASRAAARSRTAPSGVTRNVRCRRPVVCPPCRSSFPTAICHAFTAPEVTPATKYFMPSAKTTSWGTVANA
jgi:hypothetical protein